MKSPVLKSQDEFFRWIGEWFTKRELLGCLPTQYPCIAVLMWGPCWVEFVYPSDFGQGE